MTKRSERKLTTQRDIIRTATRLFLEIGYHNTTPRMVCKEMNISPGTLTYHFSTKEKMLAVLIEILADFQWKTVQELVNEGETQLTALCFELTAMAVMCEKDEIARDLYISAYTSPAALATIRRNDAARAKRVFAEFCPGWTDEQFAEAETLVSGIEYATLHTTPDSPPLELRITGAMNAILSLYNVPEERRQRKIEKALGMDYHAFAMNMLDSFKHYVVQTTDEDLNETKMNSFMGQSGRIAQNA